MLFELSHIFISENATTKEERQLSKVVGKDEIPVMSLSWNTTKRIVRNKRRVESGVTSHSYDIVPKKIHCIVLIIPTVGKSKFASALEKMQQLLLLQLLEGLLEELKMDMRGGERVRTKRDQLPVDPSMREEHLEVGNLCL